MFFGKPTGMPISTYAEGRFSRLDPLIESELRGQHTWDIDESGGWGLRWERSSFCQRVRRREATNLFR
jgi:hypothetical protein